MSGPVSHWPTRGWSTGFRYVLGARRVAAAAAGRRRRHSARFPRRPGGSPLAHASGKVQVTSLTIAGFGYADCPGHPAWLPATDGPTAAYPLTLIANQPATRLHSQLDFGAHSASQKRGAREVCSLNPRDAAARGIAHGDLVRLYNGRGACLASAALSDAVMAGVIQLPTGAWYDPAFDAQGAQCARTATPTY